LKFQDDLANSPGNTFIANRSANSDTTVNMNWQNDTTILIGYPKGLEVFKKDPLVRGIRVRYETE
jgi:hypothetical protein